MNNHARKCPRHHVRSRHLVRTRQSAGCSPWTRANLHRHPRVKPLSWPRLWMCVCWSTQPSQPGAAATRCLARNMIEFVPKHAPEHRYCRVPCRGCSGSKKEKRSGMLKRLCLFAEERAASEIVFLQIFGGQKNRTVDAYFQGSQEFSASAPC